METKRERRAATAETGRVRRKLEQKQAARRRQYIFAGIVVLVIAVAGVVASLILRDKGSSDGFPAIAAATTTVDPSVPQNGFTLGDPKAKVTVTEWGDFQCPYCGDFAKNAQQQLIADYVKTGKIKYDFKNLAFLGEESVQAAQAAACAADQNKFWPFHDAIYANQSGENKGAFSASRLEQIAKVAGLNVDDYKTCVSNDTHKDDVAATTTQGRAIPITSTPSFVIDGKVVVWSNYADLKTAIDAALAKAGA